MADTVLIDNRDGRTLAKALEAVLSGSGVWESPLPNELDVATAVDVHPELTHLAG